MGLEITDTKISIMMNFHSNSVLLRWLAPRLSLPELSVGRLCLLCIAAVSSVEVTLLHGQAGVKRGHWVTRSHVTELRWRSVACQPVWMERKAGGRDDGKNKERGGGGVGDLETLREKASRRPREVRKNRGGGCSLLAYCIWRNTCRIFYSPRTHENQRKCFVVRKKKKKKENWIWSQRETTSCSVEWERVREVSRWDQERW